jgi:hypothetical protein
MSYKEPDVLVFAPPSGQPIIAALTELYRKLRGGSGGKSPDPNDKGWIVLLLIIWWIITVFFEGWLKSRLPFTISVIGLMVLICSAPIVSGESRRAVRVVIETLIVIGAVALFLWREFGAQAMGKWILYTTAIVLVLEIGAHLVEWNKDDSIKRLSQWSDLFKFLENDTSLLDKLFRRQQITYLSIPLGFLIGLHTGLFFGYSDAMTFAACLIAILSLASLSLTYFLINSFERMIDPILTTDEVYSRAVKTVVPKSKAKAIIKGLQLVIIVPAEVDEKSDTWDLDLAHAATGLRKIYLFDSLHSTLLLLAFVGIILSFAGVNITLTRVIVSLIVATLIFCQLPFSIGQTRLHRQLLWRVKGSQEVEMRKNLDAVAPRFPAFQLLTSLATTGTGCGRESQAEGRKEDLY